METERENSRLEQLSRALNTIKPQVEDVRKWSDEEIAELVRVGGGIYNYIRRLTDEQLEEIIRTGKAPTSQILAIAASMESTPPASS